MHVGSQGVQKSAVILTFIFTPLFVHAFLDREWDIKTKILKKNFFIFSLRFADFEFSIQKIQTKVSFRTRALL
jgi:hypothetical protein